MIRHLLGATLDIMRGVLTRSAATVEQAVEDDGDWWIGGTDAEDDEHPERGSRAVRDL